MIDPKGPKPNADPHSASREPGFQDGDDRDDQPMYATEPEEAPAGGWQVPGGGRGADPSAPPDSATLPAQSAPAEAERQAPPVEADAGAALAVAEARARESHEQYLRALAEMENVRRRAQEDVSKAHKYAIESFAESLLPVRDSLEMALTVEIPSVESLKEGVEATLRQLTQAFDRHRLLVIDPLHQKFDPNRHQAISMAPSKDVAPNHVVSVLQKGYLINDRILRPALVTVSQAG